MSQNYLARAEKCFSFISMLIELSKGKKLTGYDMVVHLREFGFDVSPGTTYHQLDMLSKNGIIREKKRPWGKTNKTVYEMTEEGKEIFQEFKKRWKKPLEYAAANLQ